MPFQPPPRLSSVLASVLAAGLMLTVAGCNHLTPLGPGPATVIPPTHHLRSPLVLQAMLARQPTPAGGCPAGYATLPGANPGTCYRKTGTPATITSAAISPITSYQEKPPPGQPAAHTTTIYQIMITLPAADAPALTAVTTTASNAHGALAIRVAGKTWALPLVTRPFTGRQLPLPLDSKNQALQLQRILAASG